LEKKTKYLITQNWKKNKNILSGLGLIFQKGRREKKEEKRTPSNLCFVILSSWLLLNKAFQSFHSFILSSSFLFG